MRWDLGTRGVDIGVWNGVERGVMKGVADGDMLRDGDNNGRGYGNSST